MSKKLNRFEILGGFLKECRERTDLSQKDLGLKLGYKGGQYVYYVETGKINIPRRSMKMWLNLLKITPQQYIEMEKEALEIELTDILGLTKSSRKKIG